MDGERVRKGMDGKWERKVGEVNERMVEDVM